jgi:hypothetical protein
MPVSPILRPIDANAAENRLVSRVNRGLIATLRVILCPDRRCICVVQGKEKIK